MKSAFQCHRFTPFHWIYIEERSEADSWLQRQTAVGSRSHKLQADFSVRCTPSSAMREQSGNNLLGSCSHQQTVYCKKVPGSKAKYQPEPKAYEQKSIPSLLQKPRTSQKRDGEKLMLYSERARDGTKLRNLSVYGCFARYYKWLFAAIFRTGVKMWHSKQIQKSILQIPSFQD